MSVVNSRNLHSIRGFGNEAVTIVPSIFTPSANNLRGHVTFGFLEAPKGTTASTDLELLPQTLDKRRQICFQMGTCDSKIVSACS